MHMRIETRVTGLLPSRMRHICGDTGHKPNAQSERSHSGRRCRSHFEDAPHLNRERYNLLKVVVASVAAATCLDRVSMQGCVHCAVELETPLNIKPMPWQNVSDPACFLVSAPFRKASDSLGVSISSSTLSSGGRTTLSYELLIFNEVLVRTRMRVPDHFTRQLAIRPAFRI